MQYPQQLISSLAKQVDNSLKVFFDLESSKFSSDINNLIENTLCKFVGNKTSKVELKTVLITQNRLRLQKKKRWFNSFYDSIRLYPVEHNKSPFHNIWRDFQDRDMQSLFKLYSQKTLEKAIEKITETIQSWQKDNDSLLINYPLIAQKTWNQVFTCFQTDLIINLISIIIKSYDGNIGSYFSKKPEVLLQYPIFSASRYSLPVQEQFDNYIIPLFASLPSDLVLSVNIDKPSTLTANKKFKVFDVRDNQILSYLFDIIQPDFYESHQVIVDLGELAKAVYKRPSKFLYDDINKRLHNMQGVNFRYYKKDNLDVPVLSFNLFDSVATLQTEKKQMIVISFGRMLYEAVTKWNMISVTSSSYNSLCLDLSKLLYHNLQKERIVLNNSTSVTPEGYLYKKYDYSFFLRIVLFKKPKKAENITLIKDALEEFVNKKIAIAKYIYDLNSGCFQIYYFPLNNDELADLSFHSDHIHLNN